MLFHEIAHQRVYFKDDTELSESFATAVEQRGVEVWLEARDQTEALKRYREGLARQGSFAALIARQRDRLSTLFAGDAEVAELRESKSEAYTQMRREYELLRSGWNGVGDYDGWFRDAFNNARLVALTSYQRYVPGLRYRIGILGLPAFYAEMDSLAELDAETRKARLDEWNAASEMAALPD
jgi:predicted aminopeptidase